MTDSMSQPEAQGTLVAEVRSASHPLIRFARKNPSRLWALTIVCLLLSVGLFVLAGRSGGTRIAIHFEQGHGIKPGDLLRHRGIEVGEVGAVTLSDSLEGVYVVIELEPAASALAREGSRFCIERPRLRLAQVSGLDTVIGAKYLGVLPGPHDAAPRYNFDGDEAPLTVLDSNVVQIAIHFRRGRGLVVGSLLKHRGTSVGEVTAVDLNEDLTGVTVHVRLVESAKRLARAGSQFWIERPDVSLSGVRGLETLVGGHYLAVEPGPMDAEPLAVFVGLEDPKTSLERAAGGLEILLRSPYRYGVESGAPVSFRGLDVGHIVSVSITPDATTVEARAYIKPGYKQLVRDNSKFWSTSGIDVNIGLTGFELNAETLKTIAAGGVAFATPDDPGNLVSSGHGFALSKKAEDQWLKYRARLPVGSTLLPAGTTLPSPFRVTVRWQEKRLSITRNRQREGLALLLDDGRLLAPLAFFPAVEKVIDGSLKFEFAGLEHVASANSISSRGGLATCTIATDLVDQHRLWPTAKIRSGDHPEDCLLVSDSPSNQVPLPAERLASADHGWLVDSSVQLQPLWQGASVVATHDGALLGMLLLDGAIARIEFVHQTQSTR